MTDPRLQTVLPLALGRIRGMMERVLDQTVVKLAAQASASNSHSQRQLMLIADRELRLKAHRITSLFERELQGQIDQNLTPTMASSPNSLVNTDWASLSLVDHDQVERDVIADRLALTLTGACQASFDILTSYLNGLLDDASPERSPLRPKLIAKALLDGMSQSDMSEESIRTIVAMLPGILGPQLSECYALVTSDMRGMGLLAQGMTVFKSAQPAVSRHTPQQTSRGTEHSAATPETVAKGLTGSQSTAHSAAQSRAAQAIGTMFGVPVPEASAGNSDGGMASNEQFHRLLKQLSQQTTQVAPQATSRRAAEDDTADPSTPLMAVNQIRAHQEQLVKASGGAALDTMVIDIVAALFDQVLSDPKVAPEMARQIARLQMPVLRVALGDMNFFNSRKHPVRRLINRMATLSAAFDLGNQTGGTACLERITQLVNDIVEGDFERMDVYEQKLRELEASVEIEATKDATENTQATALLSAKEADLRVQQRYMQIMQRELVDIEVPDFLRDFLAKVWSRVQVAAASHDGIDSALAQRMRKAGRSLALSVQPKGHPKMRQAFLMQLPTLMKDLHEGLGLIRFPETDKQAFFAALLPTHADCLKASPQHELTQRLLDQRLRQLENIPIPTQAETAHDTLPSPLDSLKIAPDLMSEAVFNAEEIKQSGLMTEAALDIDLDLNCPAPVSDPTLAELDINLDSPAPPAAGLQLVHHIQKGTPYHMVMQGKWEKVRLTWVSEGRTFFIFTTGHLHKQTISLTGRTLAKMCETGRFKAFEQAELIERATVRARKQLAALSASALH